MQLFLNKIFCQLESRWDRIVAGDCPPEGAGQQREQGGDGFQDYGQVGYKKRIDYYKFVPLTDRYPLLWLINLLA